MRLSFDHVHIICRDLEGMVAYFEKIFGGEIIYREENFHGAPNAVVRVGEARLFLRGVRPGERIGENHADAVMGLDHFSFAVDDIHGLSAQMKAAGADFIRDPSPSGMGGRTTAYIRGPEDVRIELSERAGETYGGG